MKKVLIALLVIAAVYAVGAVVLAVANGQAEGKVVSEQKQLLVDGDMEASGVGSWDQYHATASKVAGAAIDGTQILHIAYAGNAVGSAYQGGFTVGKTYRMTGWARGDGTSVPEVRTNTGTLWSGTTSTEWQQIDTVFVYAGNGNFQLGSSNFQSSSYVEFDDIFLTEYTGDMTNANQQLLTDGDFEKSGTSDWTVFQITPSKEAGAAKDGDRILRLAYDGSHSSGLVYQTIFTVGEEYRITAWARGDGTGRPRIQDGLGGILWIGTTSASWQRADVHGVAAHTRIYLYGELLSAGHYVEFDDVVITEYTGDMTNADQQILVDGDMEKSGTANWTPLYSGVLSKEAGAAKDGNWVIRVTVPAASDPTYGVARQSPLTVGKTYHIKGWARGDGNEKNPVLGNVSIASLWSGTTSTVWQRFDLVFTAEATPVRLGATGLADEDGWTEFDDVFVTAL